MKLLDLSDYSRNDGKESSIGSPFHDRLTAKMAYIYTSSIYHNIRVCNMRLFEQPRVEEYFHG
jgi:hypothetical protein